MREEKLYNLRHVPTFEVWRLSTVRASPTHRLGPLPWLPEAQSCPHCRQWGSWQRHSTRWWPLLRSHWWRTKSGHSNHCCSPQINYKPSSLLCGFTSWSWRLNKIWLTNQWIYQLINSLPADLPVECLILPISWLIGWIIVEEWLMNRIQRNRQSSRYQASNYLGHDCQSTRILNIARVCRVWGFGFRILAADPVWKSPGEQLWGVFNRSARLRHVLGQSTVAVPVHKQHDQLNESPK